MLRKARRFIRAAEMLWHERRGGQGKMQGMKHRVSRTAEFGRRMGGGLLLLAALATGTANAEVPSAEATAGFNAYIAKLETRLAQQHRAANGFVALPADAERLRAGELAIEKLSPDDADLPGAMLHHWRGTAFVPGATVADFERVLRDYGGYPQRYAPQVVSAWVLEHDGDHYRVTMRVRQKHVITVVMDTAYEVRYGRRDARAGFSTSHSTRVDEIDGAGTAHEHTLSEHDAHGFLWRMNTYWSYEERDGGLYMQVESVSLSRAIPAGLGWVIGPFVESVPRESLEFTLHATRDALEK